MATDQLYLESANLALNNSSTPRTEHSVASESHQQRVRKEAAESLLLLQGSQQVDGNAADSLLLLPSTKKSFTEPELAADSLIDRLPTSRLLKLNKSAVDLHSDESQDEYPISKLASAASQTELDWKREIKAWRKTELFRASNGSLVETAHQVTARNCEDDGWEVVEPWYECQIRERVGNAYRTLSRKHIDSEAQLKEEQDRLKGDFKRGERSSLPESALHNVQRDMADMLRAYHDNNAEDLDKIGFLPAREFEEVIVRVRPSNPRPAGIYDRDEVAYFESQQHAILCARRKGKDLDSATFDAAAVLTYGFGYEQRWQTAEDNLRKLGRVFDKEHPSAWLHRNLDGVAGWKKDVWRPGRPSEAAARKAREEQDWAGKAASRAKRHSGERSEDDVESVCRHSTRRRSSTHHSFEKPATPGKPTGILYPEKPSSDAALTSEKAHKRQESPSSTAPINEEARERMKAQSDANLLVAEKLMSESSIRGTILRNPITPPKGTYPESYIRRFAGPIVSFDIALASVPVSFLRNAAEQDLSSASTWESSDPTISVASDLRSSRGRGRVRGRPTLTPKKSGPKVSTPQTPAAEYLDTETTETRPAIPKIPVGKGVRGKNGKTEEAGQDPYRKTRSSRRQEETSTGKSTSAEDALSRREVGDTLFPAALGVPGRSLDTFAGTAALDTLLAGSADAVSRKSSEATNPAKQPPKRRTSGEVISTVEPGVGQRTSRRVSERKATLEMPKLDATGAPISQSSKASGETPMQATNSRKRKTTTEPETAQSITASKKQETSTPGTIPPVSKDMKTLAPSTKSPVVLPTAMAGA
ncbi:hypothetical protein MBLNU230_g2221t1 [Neophaeotheca triangularis]